MPICGTPDKMAEKSLAFMIEWHESFAAMWDRKNEPGMKQQALSMAKRYRDELERRKCPDSWADPDR